MDKGLSLDPCSMRSLSRRYNNIKYYMFHWDYNQNTKDCVDLNEQMDKFIYWEHLNISCTDAKSQLHDSRD